MSKYDKEREAMGLKPLASSASAATTGVSKYAAERDYYNNTEAYNARGAAEMDESRQVNASREPAPEPKPDVETRARQLPVIGPVLRGLDAFATNPVVDKVASLARSFYVPGAGLANVAGLTEAAGSAVGRALPALGASAGGRIAKSALTEGLAGAPIGVGQELMVNPDANATDLARGAALGGAFGAGFGGGLTGLAEGASRVAGSAANSLARNAFEQASQAAPALRRVESPSKIKAASSIQNIPEPPASLSGLLQEMRSAPAEAPAALQGFKRSDSANLQELLSAKGLPDDSAESIAQAYNGKNWYHGTGTDNLTADMLDPFAGSHESLFGQGVYLTDSPPIAKGYANSRGGRRGSTPTIYETGVNMNRVLDLEKPITSDVVDAIDQSVKSLDYVYQQELGKPNYFTNFVKEQVAKPGATAENVIQSLRKEVESFSHEAEIPTSEFVENFQDLAINLKQAGYDGLTHTGGGRTGNEAHRVLILLDPQNAYGAGSDTRSQISRFSKYSGPTESFSGDVPSAASVTERGGVQPESKYAAEREQIKQEQPAAEPVKPPGDLPTLGFSPFAKKGKFTNPEDTRTYIVSKTEREPINYANAADKFYEKTVDNLQRLNTFDKKVESVTGEQLSPEQRSYYLALNNRGADMISNHILTEKLVDAQGNVIGKSLKDISSQIPRQAYDNFKDYLIAKHAPTRMNRGERVYDPRTNMTAEKAEQKAAEYEKNYPQFKAIADQLYDWNDKLVQAWLVDTGIISPETAAAWKEQNPFWIPNKRAFNELEKRGKFAGAKRGFADMRNPVKGYTPGGSERPIIDPFESLIEYVDQYVKTAKRNEVMQTVIKNLQRDPEALEGFAKLVNENDFASQKSLKELNEALSKDGIEGLVDKLNADFDVMYNKPAKQRIAGKDNIVTGLIDGKPVAIEVTDPALLDAMTNLSPGGRNAVIEIARTVTNAMKLLTTGINPVFSLTRNIFRDIPAAFIFSKTTNNPYRFAVDLLDGVVSTFGNKELYQRYKALGGGHSSPVATDRNLLKQSKRAILPQQQGGKGLLPRLYHGLENLSNVVESAPRLGEFKRITQEGGDDYASRVQGLYEANDITTNFKRKGTVTKDADAFYPYLNAAVQGLDKFARGFKDNPKAVAAKSALAITVPTLALYALNYDNPNYEKLSNNVKDNFFLFPKGDGKFIKIPRPRELGIPFGAALERVMRAWLQKDPESFKDFAGTVRTAFAPPGVSGLLNEGLPGLVSDTVAGPLSDLAANKNFAGSPIVPKYLEGLSPRYQYDANTSEVSKKIGDVLNISPKQLDYLISSYTGVIGQLGIPATNEGATIGGTLLKQVTADPAFSTDATRNFYDLKDKVDQRYNDAKYTGVVPPGYNDDVRKYLTKTAGDLSDVTAALRALDKMPLTAEQKKEKKRQLTELRNDTARKAYQAVQSLNSKKP